MTTIPSALTTADEVHTLLEAVAHVDVFRGKVGTVTTGDDGSVNAYAVAYYGIGAPRATRLGAMPRNLALSWQVTCVGGDDVKALWCVDQVRAALTGQRITVDGRSGVVRELGDPGPIRPDRDVTPWRYYLPLDFGLYL